MLKNHKTGSVVELNEKSFRYCVLYIQDVGQHRFKEIIGKYLPKEHGEVFIPRMELYRRGEKNIKEVPIFPGYVFIYTDFDMKEVHRILKNCRVELNCAIKELAFKERRMGNPNFLYEELEDGELCGLSDLDKEETDFFNLLRQGNGLLTMSCGYEENKKYHVMEGPLKAYEDKIQRVDKHNRKAFLNFEISGRQVRVGFECKPKAHWHPKKETQITILSDGTEVDLEELKKSVITI